MYINNRANTGHFLAFNCFEYFSKLFLRLCQTSSKPKLKPIQKTNTPKTRVLNRSATYQNT